MGFDRVLIANRGEIAVRIAATLRRLGVESVAVHAPQDAGAPHVAACDHAVALRADGDRSPYLDVAQLLDVARRTGSQAVHPGYGFLAERADAAQAFEDAGVAWIGPTPAAIDLLGDKIASKRTAAEADVPVVPGLQGEDVSVDQVQAFAAEAGLPLLLKASAGGGGKGMRRVDAADQIAPAVDAARREALAAFGRAELLVERLVEPARHVEVQIAADAHGGVWAIGERECSLQRRHQKLIEESPAPHLPDDVRRDLHAAAVRLAAAAGYRNLGTVEFLVESGVEAPRFFFLEMNARLQVEHPVTELVHGLDLVELQLRIANGERLDLAAALGEHGPLLTPVGHAIEARICAERIAVGAGGTGQFLPATGPVVGYAEPRGAGVRVDSGLATGSEVTTAFDPMLMKVIAYGRDRAQARDRLDRALDELTVLGVQTNAGFLRRLLARPEVVEGRTTTTMVEALLADPEAAGGLQQPPAAATARAATAAAAWRHHELEERSGGAAASPFDRRDGWRIGPPAAARLRLLDADDEPLALSARVVDGALEVTVDEADPRRASVAIVPAEPGAPRRLDVGDGEGAARWSVARDGEWLWIHGPDGTWSWRDAPEASAAAAHGSGSLEAPLPGVVIAIKAQPGDVVTAGTPVVVVESMKMELDVTAPYDGVVQSVDVAVGEHVQRGQVLAAVEQEDQA
ncbi:acetyl/propionyl/methylcrotonyl-CoA carboxylase subunit alpha [Patulibacter defluvii]|uniref:acetyl/propionyl/methylcrotonyl-CoA carboxylase subunit alpha n=1 Tax=Patulibacter defluvii TaxID=3095358 RepID=UPI002A760FE5|nr:biotin carboxylase N-terminal domain-containing protein [Patulibacter sp. DM4]